MEQRKKTTFPGMSLRREGQTTQLCRLNENKLFIPGLPTDFFLLIFVKSKSPGLIRTLYKKASP
jgi:hypothetical protein